MPPLTVVIADDSALYRQLLRNVLSRIDGVEVVGMATDGREAVDLVLRLRPDALTLDLQMPALDGIGVLRQLRERGSPTKAIMVSSLTGEGAPATVEALLEGAFDYVLKPAGLEPHLARELIGRTLAEKLSAVGATLARLPAPPAAPTADPRRASLPYEAIAIGCSTGGPEALRQVVPRLPRGLPVPLFVVQHMPPVFTATLARRLDDMSAVDVVEASDGMKAEPGRVHVAAGGRHLRVVMKDQAVTCVLDDAPPRLGCRPAFDNLLESMLEIYAGRVVAVVMTGMGSDGTEGCRRLKEKGGAVIAQSADTCTVYGMPKSVIDRGLADAVVPLGSLADTVLACRPQAAQPKTSDKTSSAT